MARGAGETLAKRSSKASRWPERAAVMSEAPRTASRARSTGLAAAFTDSRNPPRAGRDALVERDPRRALLGLRRARSATYVRYFMSARRPMPARGRVSPRARCTGAPSSCARRRSSIPAVIASRAMPSCLASTSWRRRAGPFEEAMLEDDLAAGDEFVEREVGRRQHAPVDARLEALRDASRRRHGRADGAARP